MKFAKSLLNLAGICDSFRPLFSRKMCNYFRGSVAVAQCFELFGESGDNQT